MFASCDHQKVWNDSPKLALFSRGKFHEIVWWWWWWWRWWPVSDELNTTMKTVFESLNKKNPEYCHMQSLKPLQAQHLWSFKKNTPPGLVAQGKLYAVSHLLVSLQSRDSLKLTATLPLKWGPNCPQKEVNPCPVPLIFRTKLAVWVRPRGSK